MRLQPFSFRLVTSAIFALGAAAPGGCGGPVTDPAWKTKMSQLEERLAAQSRSLEEKDEQIRLQTKRIRDLIALPEGRRLESLPQVDRIELATLSGGADEDRDGIDEKLILYLRPIDRDGDTIKAAGTVSVRLLDLHAAPDAQKVGAVELGLDELRAVWYGRLSSHYTIKVPWAGGVKRAPHKTITALVTFMDYVTGRTFTVQKAFQVRGAASPD
ncbi:MAG: hypothetical protein ACE5F9_13740 [Phycisphaerae bacterium]